VQQAPLFEAFSSNKLQILRFQSSKLFYWIELASFRCIVQGDSYVHGAMFTGPSHMHVLLTYLLSPSSRQRILRDLTMDRGGHAQLFFWVPNRNSATWWKHFRNRNSATFKEMFLRNRNSAIPQFRNRNFFWSPQLQICNLRASLPQFSAYFWLWSSLNLSLRLF
jgi:hypothetical protein